MISLGIDTSNYTTSVAEFNGENFTMSRKILDVGEGMRGIRQSEGVFIHNRELSEMLKKILTDSTPNVVGVSTRPRSVEGSYMPVFTVGHGYAQAVSVALGVRMYEFSHQDGHIMAGIHSAGAYKLLNEPFISLHISGGTTEIMRSQYNGYNFDNEIIGGTLDISVGQLIDRVGVNMGLKFPCGVELEKLAYTVNDAVKLPISIKDSYFNLSGVETKLLKGIGKSDAIVARSVLCYIRDVLIKAVKTAIENTGISNILIVGGVASNRIIRQGFTDEFAEDAFFATRELSSDNAVGVAVLAHMAEVRK